MELARVLRVDKVLDNGPLGSSEQQGDGTIPEPSKKRPSWLLSVCGCSCPSAFFVVSKPLVREEQAAKEVHVEPSAVVDRQIQTSCGEPPGGIALYDQHFSERFYVRRMSFDVVLGFCKVFRAEQRL